MPGAARPTCHSVSVAAVIVDGSGRVLCIQRFDNLKWEPPGGVLEPDESIEAGLRREVLEETGLEVEPVRLTGVYKNLARGIVALVFRCRVVGGEAVRTNETANFSWLSLEEVLDRMVEAFAIRVSDGLDEHGPYVRNHDGVHVNHPTVAD